MANGSGPAVCPRKWVYVLIGLCASFVVLYRLRLFITKIDEKSCFGYASEHVKLCVLDQLREKDGTQEAKWIPAIERCGLPVKDKLKIWYFENVNDVKLFVPFSHHKDAASCVGATLGVGNDTVAEEKLLEKNPNCKLFGADPVYETGKVFSTIGTYFPFGVGGKAGVARSLVLLNGEYVYRDMNLTTVHKFLELTKYKFFDFFWFDCEGAEYGILPQLLQRMDVSICQMNIEFHFIEENRQKFEDMILFMLEKTDFIPLWASCVKGHYRMFFVNSGNSECCGRFTLN